MVKTRSIEQLLAMRYRYFLGKRCDICGHNLRYNSTRRCVRCMRYWISRSKVLKDERKKYVKELCPICLKPMHQPCSDEHPVTNEPRGWLCHEDNLVLGKIKNDPARAARALAYLLNDEDEAIQYVKEAFELKAVSSLAPPLVDVPGV